MTMIKSEPFLTADDNRFVMFPIKHDDIWKMYKKQIDCFWKVEEIDLSKDLNDWNKLSYDERYYIKMILSFFAASDGIVIENLGKRFLEEVQISEVIAFYGFQMAMENIHNETYSLLIDTYINDDKEKNELFYALQNFECIQKKGDWAIKWIEDEKSNFCYSACGLCMCRGYILFRCILQYFLAEKRGLMPGLTFSNELISGDEALHTEFAVLLYSKLLYKLTENEIHSIIKDAVEIEQEFICSAFTM